VSAPNHRVDLEALLALFLTLGLPSVLQKGIVPYCRSCRKIAITLTTPTARLTRYFARPPSRSRPPRASGESAQADFFCGKLNGITFPYSSGGIHFTAFFLKLLGTKNSMIFAINHPTCNNKTEAKKFLRLTNLYRCSRADSAEDIRIPSVIACSQQLSAINSVFAPNPLHYGPHAINFTNRLVTILAPISKSVAEKHHPGETQPPETCDRRLCELPCLS
jgi:hypothetical protein